MSHEKVTEVYKCIFGPGALSALWLLDGVSISNATGFRLVCMLKMVREHGLALPRESACSASHPRPQGFSGVYVPRMMAVTAVRRSVCVFKLARCVRDPFECLSICLGV